MSDEYDDVCEGFEFLLRENERLGLQLAATERRLKGSRIHAAAMERRLEKVTKARPGGTKPPSLTSHAVARFRERVRPDLDDYDARALLIRLVDEGGFIDNGDGTAKIMLGPIEAKCVLRDGVPVRWLVKTVTARAWDKPLRSQRLDLRLCPDDQSVDLGGERRCDAGQPCRDARGDIGVEAVEQRRRVTDAFGD